MDNRQAANLLNEISELIGSAPDSDDAASGGLKMIQEAQQLQRYAQTRRSGRFNWLMVGAFNNGKSTLVNALLGVEAVLTGVVPTTAVVTRLNQGDTSRITVHPRNGEPYPIDPATYWEDYDLSAKTDWAEVDHLEINGVFELLPEGVTLIDTPGLDEDRLRTALALEYLPHASAVIVVIDAIRPLSKAERDFIALLGLGRLENVFFVINRIDMLSPDELPEVKSWIQSRLKHHFSDLEGHFSESLYNRRVFFTNAALAENRLSETDAIADASGITPLRQALTDWLSQSEQSNSASEQQTLISVLADVLHNARQRMAYQLSGWQQPLAMLEAQLMQSAERLQQMQRDSKAIQKRISQASNVIKHLIYSDLVQYSQTMKSTWEADVALLDLEKLANTNIFSAKFSDQDKTAMANALSYELQRYMQLKLIQWAKQLPEALQVSVNDLLEDIRCDLRSFQLELDEIAGLTGEKLMGDYAVRRKAGLLQIDEALYSEVFNDKMLLQLIRPMTDQILTDLSNNQKFKNVGLTVIRVVLDAGSFLLFQGRGSQKVIGIISQIGGALIGQLQQRQDMDELYGGGAEKSQKLDRTYADMGSEKVEKLQKVVRVSLVENLRSPLFDQVHKTIVGNRDVIFQQIEAEFENIGADIGAQLKGAITEVRATQQQLVVTRRSQQSSLDQIQSRHQALEQALRSRIDTLCTATISRMLSDHEIEQLSESRAIFISRPDHSTDIIEVLTFTEPPSSSRPFTAPSPPPTKDVNTRLLNAVKTAFGLEHIADDNSELSNISTDLAKMVGLEDVKRRILELMDYQAEIQRRQQSGFNSGEPPSLHLVFTGNPGTGKTTVAEIIGKMYHRLGLLRSGHLLSVSRADLVGAFVGHSEKKVRKLVEQAYDGVLFIDEAYALVKADSPNDFGIVALEELMRCMENARGRLAVVVAGYPSQMQDFLQANPGLMSRFPPDNVIHFPDYAPIDLQQILKQILSDGDYHLLPEAQMQVEQVIAGLYASRDKQFGNAREMRNLAQTLIRRRAARIRRTQRPVDDPISPEDINDYYQAFVSASPQQTDSTEAALEKINQLIGLGSVKETLSRLVERSKLSSRLGEPIRVDTLHTLFRGGPGTGKTTVAEQFGKVLKGLGYLRRGHLVAVSRGDLVGGYIGESEKKTRAVLEKAQNGVLLIDEAYSLFVDNASQDFGRVVLNELTAYLDQYRDRLVVILAGYPDEIDALLAANPGLRDRFRTPIDFQDYSPNELLQICRKMAADDGYHLSTTAEARVAFYLDRKRAIDPDRFGNARAVRVLLDEMKDRMALRISDVAESITDENEFRILAKQLEEKDVPPVPKFGTPKARRMTVVIDARGRPLARPLNIDMVSPSADYCR
jgi:SpoVK/Ycf46/Vps4 family AAA+-type ATPase/ribosome biogenesis GTPase A